MLKLNNQGKKKKSMNDIIARAKASKKQLR